MEHGSSHLLGCGNVGKCQLKKANLGSPTQGLRMENLGGRRWEGQSLSTHTHTLDILFQGIFSLTTLASSAGGYPSLPHGHSPQGMAPRACPHDPRNHPGCAQSPHPNEQIHPVPQCLVHPYLLQLYTRHPSFTLLPETSPSKLSSILLTAPNLLPPALNFSHSFY